MTALGQSQHPMSATQAGQVAGKPRILFVDHIGVLGGAELFLLDVARHFKDGSRVVLFEDGPLRERLQRAEVDVELIPASAILSKISREGGLLRDLIAIPSLLKLAWQVARHTRGYDVIYANSQKSMVVTALAGWMIRRPVIWYLHDLMTTDHFSRTHCRIAATLANRFVTRVIANSNATRNAFVENGGREDRIFTVYNGIDMAPFARITATEVERLRAELGLEGISVVGVFSRLAHWKGQHVLLEALKDLPNVHALLVGDALFAEDTQYAESLHRQAEQLGIVDRIHFLGFRHDVPLLLSLVDVVVHTSIAPEPFGRVIVEGMLAGKPVVATRAGGALEIIEDLNTGLLVPPGDPQALVEVLTHLFAEPETAKRIAQAGQQEARERFSVERLQREIAKHVQEVVERRRSVAV